jgi:RNase P subunit RPR2
MIDCAYCGKPLICEKCQAVYIPPTEDHYQALSQPDILLDCPGCGAILVCHWCKTPYDGLCDGGDSSHPAQGGR